MSVPLWSPENTSVYSSVFSVAPGKVIVLWAADFPRFKFQVENEPRTPARACVRRLVHEFGGALPVAKKSGCDWLLDFGNIRSELAADIDVVSNGCTWSLDKCDCVKAIGVPGVYQLELNDSTIVGTAQVYAEQYDVAQLAPQVRDIFFQ